MSFSSASDAELRERLVRLEQIANAAQAAQADVMTEITHRAGANELEFVADEIAITLNTTKAVASARLGVALQAAGHASVMAAWRQGTIDARKAAVIGDGLIDASPLAIETLTDGAIQYAQTHTCPELRRWLQRRVIAADPDAAEAGRQRALSRRKVTLTPLGNGLTELCALLPGVQARQVYDTINAIAHAAEPDEQRTIDQRRADTFVDLVVGRAEPPQVTVGVVMPIDTLLGRSDAPGSVHGVGPVTAVEARRLARDADLARLLTDPADGHLLAVSETQYRPSSTLERLIRARDVVCRFPGCSRPASTKRSGTDLDHTVPWPHGETAASNLAVLCRHHHRLKHSRGWSVDLGANGVMRWTTPTGKTFVTAPWVYTDPG